MYEQFPNLLIKNLEGGNLLLETVDCGESYMVEVHPSQVRLMAEYLGIVPAPPPADDDEQQPEGPRPAELAREVARLRRSLLAVQNKAQELSDYIRDCSDWQHADLTGEALRVTAIVDMLGMACGDFSTPPEPEALKTPENGALERTQKRGSSTPEQMTIEGTGDER